MKSLIWITNSFRIDSRLTSKLQGKCSFVYYSPYYFAGNREKEIYDKCSKENLDAFYQSLRAFDQDLRNKGFRFLVFKESNPIDHINRLVEKYQFDKLIIDQPLFAMWQSIDLLELKVPYEIIDSALIDDTCFKMTAKSRWMSHVKRENEKPLLWNSEIEPLNIEEPSRKYPKVKDSSPFLDVEKILHRAKRISCTYGLTRDRHDGQTQLSILMQNGMIDPHNVFFDLVEQFRQSGANLSVNEGLHASMLRQFAFREMNIIHARRNNLTLENTPLEWAKTLMTASNYQHLIESKPKPDSSLTFEKIKSANTGIVELDKILKDFVSSGYMPNRARMYFAGKIFYESRSGIEAIQLLIDTFDLIGLDGQSPNNYLQCCSALNLQYGKVMLLNANRTFDLLQYENN